LASSGLEASPRKLSEVIHRPPHPEDPAANLAGNSKTRFDQYLTILFGGQLEVEGGGGAAVQKGPGKIIDELTL
jgi:hypothetical protein